MSGNSDKDRDLDAYLRGDSSFSRAYREESRELPPEHVDAQILAEAHRADAGDKRAPARGPFAGGSWMVPASVAAVVVLAVSVTVLLPEGRPGYERQRIVPEDTLSPSREAADADPLDMPEVRQAPAAEYAVPPPGREVRPDASTVAEPAPAPASAAPQASGAAAPEQERALRKETAPAAPAAVMQNRVEDSGDSAKQRLRSKSGIATAGEGQAAGKSELETFEEPDVWLEHIEDLIERGELEAARQSLSRFRLAYPGAEVPRHVIDALKAGAN